MYSQDFRTRYLASLSNEDFDRIQAFIRDYRCHLCVSKKDTRLMIDDALRAVEYLTQTEGITLEEALERTSARNLGGFYAHEVLSWYPLDDAAKIYPLSMKFGRMPMFRVSCYLKENVVPQILQLALDFTIKRFPYFATVVRKGFFWHYLDSVKRRFSVQRETERPCHPIRIAALGSQSFKIVFFQNRISLEIFHVLTDGTGAMVFLKTLVAQYLRLLGVKLKCTDGVFDVNELPNDGEQENEFKRLSPKTSRSGGFMGRSALQMSGRLSKNIPCKIVHLVWDSNQLVSTAHRYNTTVTALVLAMMFISNKFATEERNGAIQIQVPVNMRKYYETQTLRNFSMYCSIDIQPDDIKDVESLLPVITSQLRERATEEEMSIMMATAHRLVKSVKVIPLFIKQPVASVIYGYLGDSRFSNTLSNLGVISMPEGAQDYIDSFDFILGTCEISRASCSMCTYNTKTVFSISKSTPDASFEEKMCELAGQLGIDSEVLGSLLYD